MTIVRPFEADILHLLHAILGDAPREQAVRVLMVGKPRPKCLGRPAIALIQNTLARGCVRRLARRGGWRNERFLRGDRVASGRLWERTSPEELGLTFSAQSLEFLIRLVALEPTELTAWPGPGSLGDRVLAFLTFEAFRAGPVGLIWRKSPLFRAQALCRLAFPADFAGSPEGDAPGLADLVEPGNAWVLEALQGVLAGAWVDAGLSKHRGMEPDRVQAIGEEESRVAEAFLSAVEAAGRLELARFFLVVARELLGSENPLRRWIHSPMVKGLRLEERARIARASLAPLTFLDRLRGWERQARSVGYFDEGYAAAQLWKSDWERAGGDDLRDRARSLLREADPLAGAL